MADPGHRLMASPPIRPVQDLLGRLDHSQHQSVEQSPDFREGQRDAARCLALYAARLPVPLAIPFFTPAFAAA